jgi:hypothetical protein
MVAISIETFASCCAGVINQKSECERVNSSAQYRKFLLFVWRSDVYSERESKAAPVHGSLDMNFSSGECEMKKSLITTLVAVPLLSLSSMSFAAEPVLLTAPQMDNVTAGTLFSFKRARVTQINVAPVTAAQVSVLNIGVLSGNNTAVIGSGNTSSISQ